MWFVSSLELPALCPIEMDQREEVGKLWCGCLMGSPVSIPQAAAAFLPLSVLKGKTYPPAIIQTPGEIPQNT